MKIVLKKNEFGNYQFNSNCEYRDENNNYITDTTYHFLLNEKQLQEFLNILYGEKSEKSEVEK